MFGLKDLSSLETTRAPGHHRNPQKCQMMIQKSRGQWHQVPQEWNLGIHFRRWWSNSPACTNWIRMSAGWGESRLTEKERSPNLMVQWQWLRWRLLRAEEDLIKFVQTHAHKTEIRALQQGNRIAHSSSIRPLSPALQNGVKCWSLEGDWSMSILVTRPRVQWFYHLTTSCLHWLFRKFVMLAILVWNWHWVVFHHALDTEV